MRRISRRCRSGTGRIECFSRFCQAPSQNGKLQALAITTLNSPTAQKQFPVIASTRLVSDSKTAQKCVHLAPCTNQMPNRSSEEPLNLNSEEVCKGPMSLCRPTPIQQPTSRRNPVKTCQTPTLSGPPEKSSRLGVSPDLQHNKRHASRVRYC